MTELDEPSPLSLLLSRARAGECGALNRVFDAAYGELCALARARLGRRPASAGDDLEMAVLVHETFLRLSQRGALRAEHRPHFFKYAGHVMRSVIVDSIRGRTALRRGGGVTHAALPADLESVPQGDETIPRVHEALEMLEVHDPELVAIVHMRFFGGMTDAEIAEALGVTDRTVRRRWERARAILMDVLAP